MKPLVILAIAAVAVGAMGTGFLSNENGINLWIQQFGVGDGNIQSPVTHATVDFHIDTVPIGSNGGTTFENVIDECYLTFGTTVVAPSHIFCKLTDWNGDIIAEGTTWFNTAIPENTAVTVEISQGNQNVLDVKDVIIVVQSGYSMAAASTAP